MRVAVARPSCTVCSQVSPTESNAHNCDAYAAIVSVVDMLFKWVTIRMIDNNVQGTNRLVTFLVSLLDLLRHNGYRMSEVEAAILLPSLVEKVCVAPPLQPPRRRAGRGTATHATAVTGSVD